MAAHYQILERVCTTAGSHLHRARRVADGAPAVLKLLEPGDIPVHGPRFRREYALLRALDVAGVVKPLALIDEPGTLMMVLGGCDGEPLENLLARQATGLPLCLRWAAQLGQILAGLHAAHVVHRDLRPANLMVSPQNEIRLLDVSLATVEPAATALADHPTVGDWAYISPEQTGRMSRAVDHRTDFYSLGVTLYRMLTGQLPCQGSDPLEWAHCHLASLARPPSELNPAVPPVVSAIVLKLLEKMPEDRYQSAHGLVADLERCLAQLGVRGTVAPFDLSAHDMPEHLRIPHKLAGREAEFKQLLGSFDAMAASGSASLLLVSGGAGVGKSALVRELHQPIVARRGLFVSGKFDQYQHEIPYDTMTQAFRELVQQILTEDEAGIAAWRRQIQQAVGINGRLITDVLPQTELIIGAQAPVPRLPPAEAQQRFRMAFQKFVGVFAQQAHPLTLFLDDLQWADPASLRLVRELAASPDSRYLLVIGAFRDYDVGPRHRLTLALEDMRTEGAAITRIALAPLTEEAVGAFLADMLHCERGAAEPLAHLVYQKTAGNPFFMIQFVSALADEGMIAFDPDSATWRWDLAGIGAKGYTDNVAALMVGKLARLPAPAQALLQKLACLGPEADVATLVMLSAQPEAHSQEALEAAVRTGLVVRAGASVRFLHDRVQEAAYLSMPASARAALHLQIGRLLMAGKTADQVDEAVFSIVSQFNRGAAGIDDACERELVCHLNFLAGRKAKAAIAYGSARGFLERALALLPADAWQAQYRETLELTLAASECEFHCGDLERAGQLADRILANAQSRCDSARVYCLRIQLCQMAGRYEEAVASMIEAARMFDLTFPTAGPAAPAVDAEMSSIGMLLQGRRIADIAQAQPLADADMGAAIGLLVEALPAAYMVQPDYYALTIAKAVRLSLGYGYTEASCDAYSNYGILLLSRTGDIASALEFAEMALQLNRKLDGRRSKGRLLAAHACAFSPFKDAFSDITPMLDQAFAASIEVGDLVYANYVTMVYFWVGLQQGAPLDEVLQSVRRHAQVAHDRNHDAVYRTLRFQQQLVANLKGQTHGPASMDDGEFDEAEGLAALEQASFGFGVHTSHILKLVAAFIHGDYRSALASAQQAAHPSRDAVGLILMDSVHLFYRALTMAALYPQASAAEQAGFAAVLAETLARSEAWARHCPRNFLNCHALIGAEIARIEGRESDAAHLYEQAIGSARDNGIVQNEAIAYELASVFYRRRGFGLVADTYLREARDGYLRWGADSKVAQLDARHPQLLARPLPEPAAPVRDVTRLDLLSVAKASQAISSRIVLVELVDTLMRIVVENAGAQNGCLLLARNGGLVPAAEACLDQHAVQVHLYLGKTAPALSLPASIVNYVRRSREQVLLPDVAQPHPFSGDPYFAGAHPKSVLCLPIVRQDALVGLLYLENHLVMHAFAPERVAVLQLLASQAAISLENASLYADLQEREAKIRRLVDSNIVGIWFYDLDGNITGANDAALAMVGYSRQDLLDGKLRWTELTPPEWSAADAHAVDELRAYRACRPYEKEYVRKDGSRVPIMLAAALFEGASGQGVAFALDLSERKKAEQQVRHMANHDALTGLPNRILLQDRLSLAIAYAHRNRSEVAILFIDLDYFKHINDSLGHHVGDLVLQMTAARLQQCLREGDSVARLGGDEFVISLPLLADSSDAASVARKALDVLAQPFHVEGHELHVGASIGISVYPNDGADAETLMRTADTAMYHAKEMGRNNFQYFTAALNQAAQRRLEVGMRLRRALVRDEFVLHFQPQVDMESGAICSAEALLRWQRPGAAPISCGSFIASAEESGLIVPIGEWVLRQACCQLKIWRARGRPELKLAVNLSPRQLEPPDFCSRLARILEETGIPAGALELEITESILMQRSEFTLSTLTRLRDMGIQLALDDFGTGYSSLAYLQRFPVQALKIDQSFVHDIGTDRNHTALITAIIAMANGLELNVIAEGVETWEQASFLLARGCHSAQGFYFSAAVPAQAFSDLLFTAPAFARVGCHRASPG
jgi:diguanylate cyclase (GGDEF)-like protein/PAS domain S-box-containing protein